jgi:glucokinase
VELCLAVDIGGTKMAAGLVRDDAEVLTQEAVPTPRVDDPEDLFAAASGLIDRVARAAGCGRPVVCGVGCGGPMSRGGDEVSPLNIPAWRRFPLRSRLEHVCGLPTFVDNDAKALALGEGWAGAAVGQANFLAMVVSTGVGGGIVLDGRLLDGAAGNAGHVGHVIVAPGGRLCACGARGCLETEASGTAIAAITGRPARLAGTDMAVKTGTLVGRAVASVVNLLDLELVVVGGSVSLGLGAPFFDAAQDELDALARLEFSVGTRIVPVGLGPAGPLVGAGAVGWRGLGRLPTFGAERVSP